MGVLLALASLIVIFLTIRAVRKSKIANQVRQEANLPPGELVSIDSSREGFSKLRQQNIVSARYGISGRPDRVVRTVDGIMPVELKSGNAPRTGPYEAQVAQLAVYCLLIEEEFKTTVKEGVIQYSDRSITVKFDDRMRSWILALVEEVREAKRQNARPRRNHDYAGRCRGCGFREGCQETLWRI
jgi:CRISPR-associated exonuclease Cas4